MKFRKSSLGVIFVFTVICFVFLGIHSKSDLMAQEVLDAEYSGDAQEAHNEYFKEVKLYEQMATVNVPIKFDGNIYLNSDTIEYLSILWDFGDGQQAEGLVVEHVYYQDGNYVVTLIVNDGNVKQMKGMPVSVINDDSNFFEERENMRVEAGK